MNTQRSREIISRYRNRSVGAARISKQWSWVLPGSPEDVFPLLCPSREGDWLPGWDAELIHTESGYAEPDCVFRTDPSGTVGPGVWVFSGHEAPSRVEIVRFTPDVLFQIKATLEEGGPDRTRLLWEYILTGLTEAGNGQIEAMGLSLDRKVEGMVGALSHYLETGEMVTLQG